VDLEQHLLGIEQQFWKGDVEFYLEMLTPEALMVFPRPVGVMTTAETIQSVGTSQRWLEVAFEDARVVRLGDDVALVTYTARAMAAGASSSFTTLASSVYVVRDGSWKLTFHQQTP
jgi:hypothetical protein